LGEELLIIPGTQRKLGQKGVGY